MGFTYFSTFPPLNTWIASSAADLAPDLALAVNSSAFNIGIATAGWLGGTALTAELGAEHLPALGFPALLVPLAIALGVLAIYTLGKRRVLLQGRMRRAERSDRAARHPHRVLPAR